jgi:hypothetical protein
MRSRKSATDVKLPRLSNRRTNMLNQSSMWFSQLVCFGVYMNRRRWLTSLQNAARVGIDCPIPLFSCSPRSSPMPQALATHLTTASDLCMLRCSTIKSHGASGSGAMVWARCAAQSSSVLLGPMVGVTTSPVATSKVALKHCVPWRRYAYSGRSTRPGRLGQVGAARSSACMPVFSSVLMTWPPAWATAGACCYPAHTAATWAVQATGASGVALSQDSPRWGGTSA